MNRVSIVKSEPRCKLCRFPDRPAIDSLLLRRSLGESDENGERITGEYVLAALKEMGVENPTKDNLTVHWGKHCEVIDGGERDEQAQQLEDALGQLLAGGHTEIDVDAALRAVFKIGFSDLVRQYRNGNLKIGVSELRQIADTLERRRKTDAESELMRTFGRGMERALSAFAGNAAGARGELIEGDVIEEGEVRELEAG